MMSALYTSQRPSPSVAQLLKRTPAADRTIFRLFEPLHVQWHILFWNTQVGLQFLHAGLNQRLHVLQISLSRHKGSVFFLLPNIHSVIQFDLALGGETLL